MNITKLDVDYVETEALERVTERDSQGDPIGDHVTRMDAKIHVQIRGEHLDHDRIVAAVSEALETP